MKKDAKYYDKVYDILIKGGAVERDRQNFVISHIDPVYPCKEYRFQGYFGFGGKYRSDSNRIDYYQENHTPLLDALCSSLNLALELLDAQEKPRPVLNEKYIIVDLNNRDFMKDEQGNVNIYPTQEEAANVCGIYEFPDTWVAKLIYNHKEQ